MGIQGGTRAGQLWPTRAGLYPVYRGRREIV